ncbi:MAG: hypothetical protein KGL39_22580 [Patescibacteria group bacterium]|nr:hypothetical protein [Patescibacteria group bacterium]
MSLLAQAFAGGLASLRSVAGVPITVTRGANTSATITAGVGSTEYEIEDSGVVVETWTSRDYLIAKTDYAPTGTPSNPAKGDIIADTVNGVSKRFTVLAPQGKPVFEYSDPNQTQLRVHTKETV